jgi:methionyl-tRNA formyltransferase
MSDRPHRLRVAFAGTPDFARVALAALHAAGHDLVLVLTQPDRPAGRGLRLQPSPVKAFAEAIGLTLVQPRSLRLDGRYADDAIAARQALQQARPDVLVVTAYGLLLPTWALTLAPLGAVNIHGSLLPRWRGAAPVQRAIEAGDAQTGITLMQMDEGLDTGAMLLRRPLAIAAQDTSAALLDRLAVLGAETVVDGLPLLATGELAAQAQPAVGVSYAHKIDKAEAPIDWGQPAAVLERRMRAFDPFPGCTTELAGLPLKVWRAQVVAASGVPGTVMTADHGRLVVACGEGALELTQLQWPGGRRVGAAEFLQRHRPLPV